MLTPGLTNTPLTKSLLIYTITTSIALSLFDTKHLATIHVSPHFFPYAQFWRALLWQVAGFANSTEALFASMLVYHLRVVERAWGKRKMATFILTTLPYTTLLPPLLLTLIRPISLNTLNYLPSGPTATFFALLVQYYAIIPHTFCYRIGTSTNAKEPRSLTFSDKSTTYLIAAQLALSQFPAMIFPSVVGWVVGVAWRGEFLPGLSPSSTGFRVPAWLVGERERRGNGERGGFEDLRRRLEGEVAASTSTSVDGRRGNGEGSGLVERLRGAF